MQPSESAFDRVKSLLGKMDRSIDDARRRRLDDPHEEAGDPGTKLAQTNTDHKDLPITNGTPNGENSPEPAPDRPTSKYGRARPLREIPSQSGPSWQTA